ncbi:MAG: hypothetical protein KDI13_07015 [Alphaproteobacteria bacterium]|nr:hypothetical protein [Alphaproteobacteria bacterium]
MGKIILPDWFQELDPAIRHKLQYGPQDPYKNIEYICDLSPDEIRAAYKDPELRGLQLLGDLSDEKNVEQQMRLLIRRAAWLRETFEKSQLLEELNSKYKIVRHYGNKAVVLHWTRNQELIHQSFDEFKKSHLDRFIEAENPKTGAPERRPLADAWLKATQSPRYEYAEFMPGIKPEDEPEEILNLWQGWPLRTDIVNDSSSEPEDCRLFLNHMLYNVCGGDHNVYIYLLGWMADALLNSQRTSEVAIVLQGPQGSGKSLWAKCFMEFFCPHILTLNRPDQVAGSFNKHLQDKCIVFADEAFFAGNKQHAATLKTLVMDNEIFIHPKGVDGFMAKKCFRMIIASNDEHVIRAEIDDRRYLVLNVDAGENNQNSEYFGAIVDEWENGGKQALFQWLRGRYWQQELETGAWDVRLRPKTKGLQTQKNLSLPLYQAMVHQMLHDGELPELFDANTNTGMVFVATRLLAESRRLEPKEETALGNAIRVLAGENAQNVRVYLGEDYQRRQYRGYWLPSLEVCRQRWAEFLGRPIDWPEDVVSWGIEQQRSLSGDDIPF